MNELWVESHREDYEFYRKNIDKSRIVQESILLQNLRKNANSIYGEKYNFKNISSYDQYSSEVPVVDDYAQIEKYINAIIQGEKHVLTNEKVLFFELTSGTSGNKKFIPYTQSLLNEFRKGIAVWLFKTYKDFPELKKGKAYWSISPPLIEKKIHDSQVPVGMNSDLDYFDKKTKSILSEILISVDDKTIGTNEFYFSVFKTLLECRDLRFISVWSPNYLLKLQEFLNQNTKEILVRSEIPTERKAKLKRSLQKDFQWKTLFPQLTLVSCWTESHSQLWMDSLKKSLKDIAVQPKGLLSTEGITSIPFYNCGHSIAYTSHFYEFKNLDTHEITRSHELCSGCEYEVLLTTGGGLYRYATKDVIELVSYKDNLPQLKFLGKLNEVSDYVGEKLSSYVVSQLFYATKEKYGVDALFLHPTITNESIQYQLLIISKSDFNSNRLLETISDELMKNPYYKQCRNTRQIMKLKYYHIPESCIPKIFDLYKNSKNMIDGDVKLPAILPLGLCDELLRNQKPS